MWCKSPCGVMVTRFMTSIITLTFASDGLLLYFMFILLGFALHLGLMGLMISLSVHLSLRESDSVIETQ